MLGKHGMLRRMALGAAAACVLGALAGVPGKAQAGGGGYGHRGHGHHGGARVSAGVRVGPGYGNRGRGGYGRGHGARARFAYGRGHGVRAGVGYGRRFAYGASFGYGRRFAYGAGFGYGRGYGHRPRGAVSIYYSAPLVLPYAVAPVPVIVSPPVVVERHPSRALPSMPALEYTPREGQDAARLTLERRQCERLAWRETQPQAGGYVRTTVRTEVTADAVRYRPDPLGPTVTGAALGTIGGAIAGDAGAGAAIGALAGAASWALGGYDVPVPAQRTVEVVEREYVPPPGPDPADLREALRLCMEARGYTVR